MDRSFITSNDHQANSNQIEISYLFQVSCIDYEEIFCTHIYIANKYDNHIFELEVSKLLEEVSNSKSGGISCFIRFLVSSKDSIID